MPPGFICVSNLSLSSLVLILDIPLDTPSIAPLNVPPKAAPTPAEVIASPGVNNLPSSIATSPCLCAKPLAPD